MKKLIMLSIFALSTISANANNDSFRNYYADKADQIQPVQLRYNYVARVYKHIKPNISSIPYKTVYYNCMTPTTFSYNMFILRELYLSPPAGTVYTFETQNLGICISGPVSLP